MWLTTALIVGILATCSPVGCGGFTGSEQEEQVIMLRNKNRDDDLAAERASMVETQIARRGVKEPRVLEAMRKVPRHLFVSPRQRDEAYNDYPLPIGQGQTISQPYIVALMTELLCLEPDSRVLEIGTGSGYQAAVLAELAGEVFTIEIVEPLAEKAGDLLEEQGYRNVHTRCGDGYDGWPDEAPFDGIIITAAPNTVPRPLLDQLAEGGRLVVPVGKFVQELMVYHRKKGKIKEKRMIPVRFVPMTGKAQKQ